MLRHHVPPTLNPIEIAALLIKPKSSGQREDNAGANSTSGVRLLVSCFVSRNQWSAVIAIDLQTRGWWWG
jgi:hypothetical protein